AGRVRLHQVPKAGPPIPLVGAVERANPGTASAAAAARLLARTRRRVRRCGFMSSDPEVVVEDGMRLHAQFVERGEHGRNHYRWTAKIVLAVLRRRVVAHGAAQDLMDEAGLAPPAIAGRRVGK